jgi:hypothetical protein
MSDDPTGHEFDDIALVVSTKWRDSGCLLLVALAKAGPRPPALCPPPWMPAFAGMTVRWVNAER